MTIHPSGRQAQRDGSLHARDLNTAAAARPKDKVVSCELREDNTFSSPGFELQQRTIAQYCTFYLFIRIYVLFVFKQPFATLLSNIHTRVAISVNLVCLRTTVLHSNLIS